MVVSNIKRAIKWWSLGISILLFLGFIAIVAVFNTIEGDSSRNNSVQLQSTIPADFQGLAVSMNITGVDTKASIFRIRFSFAPIGDQWAITGGSRPKSKKKIELTLEEKTMKIDAGKNVNFQDVKVSFSEGQLNSYPFDEYLGTFSLSGTGKNAAPPGTPPPPPDAPKPEAKSEPVPVYPVLIAAARGWKFEAVMEDIGAQDGAPFTQVMIMFSARRSWTSVIFTMFLFIVMWILSIAIAVLTLSIFIRGKKASPTYLRMCVANLFAFTGLRLTFNDSPPVGTTIDTVGYFWNVLIVSTSVIAILIKYNTQIHCESKLEQMENSASLTVNDTTSNCSYDSFKSEGSSQRERQKSTSYYPHHDGHGARQRVKSRHD